MTHREYLEIACAEIGADLADEGCEFRQCWLLCYSQYRDAVEEFGYDVANSMIRAAYEQRARDRLEAMESENEHYSGG